MKQKIVIVGASGHAKVIIDILKSQGSYDIVGCTNIIGTGERIEGIPIIGNDSVLPLLLEQGVKHAFIAIGNNKIRMAMFDELVQIGFGIVNAISPFAYVSQSARLGSGIAIMPGVVINADSKIEDNVIINTGATIDHDNTIASHSHIAPGCNLAGNVTVEKGAFVGTGAKIIPNVRIGKWSIVGAGSVVIRNVENYTKVFGVPAKTNL